MSVENPLDGLEARNALANMAELMAVYVKALEEQKFTRKEALTLALGYQHAAFGGVWRGESS